MGVKYTVHMMNYPLLKHFHLCTFYQNSIVETGLAGPSIALANESQNEQGETVSWHGGHGSHYPNKKKALRFSNKASS